MPKLTPKEKFVAKWGTPTLFQSNESQLSQTHFNDICALVGHPDPVAFADNETFNFEFTNVKADGRKGRADVFYRGRFIWEYKGIHADLDKAYQQLLFYKDDLDNPPLLITSDTLRIIIHTNYTNTVKKTDIITLHDIKSGEGVRKLNTIFNGTIAEIEAMFKPEDTREYITKTTANEFMGIVEGVRSHIAGEQLEFNNEEQAHFFIRLLFCLFAESVGLLPDKLFTKIVTRPIHTTTDIQFFVKMLRELFQAMRDGQNFGYHLLPHFNGGLFDNDFMPPSLPTSLVKNLLTACRYDWSQLEPSVLGTLFERILDTTKRHQIGAHYTSKADIELIIKPVLMQPLLDEWQTLKGEVMSLIQRGDKANVQPMLQTFADKIAAIRVLDPACGSGNFLYIALQQLLDLQKEVIVFAERHGLPAIPLTVGPQQLHGMEINVYAHELAQVTVWIGYIQWRYENGLEKLPTPILRPLDTIKHMDAILAYDEQGNPVEPEWVAADVIIGNPPFLGGNRLRQELEHYVDDLFNLYKDRVPAFADLVCYWFEKSRQQIERGLTKRAGLLATNSIRGGVNRTVLQRIKETGDIFMAWSDRKWVLAGAAVRISIIGFDNGKQKRRMLNGQPVPHIYADLSNGRFDLTQAKQLSENENISFMGMSKKGPFDIDESIAQAMLQHINPSGKVNAEVVRPSINGIDVVQRPRNKWIIDFGVNMPINEAALYEKPFMYVQSVVKPIRDQVRRKRRQTYWWLFGEPCPNLRKAVHLLSRYIATVAVAKHRIFVWLNKEVVPDSALYVFARDDDYFFGILHSKMHELWSLRKGTSLENRPRYTGTTTFETFPFPWPPGHEPSEADNVHVFQIADCARQLVEFRDNWLNPNDPNIGVVVTEKRTLTNLYNALTCYREVKPAHENAWGAALSQIVALGNIVPKTYLNLADMETLDSIHSQLDRAVLAAYGCAHDLSEEEILENLLALNLERAAGV